MKFHCQYSMILVHNALSYKADKIEVQTSKYKPKFYISRLLKGIFQRPKFLYGMKKMEIYMDNLTYAKNLIGTGKNAIIVSKYAIR